MEYATSSVLRLALRGALTGVLLATCGLAEAQLTRSVDFFSAPGYDGRIQARIDGSNPTITTTATNGSAIRVGDEETNGVPDEAYRSFLTFNTSGVPENATITGASLFLTQGGGGGDITAAFGDPIVEIVRGFFGLRRNIQADDFLSPAQLSPAATLIISTSVDLTETVLSAEALPFVNQGASISGGVTQLRLRYTNFTDNSGNGDYFGFSPGGANQDVDKPTLRVTFTVPQVEVLALPSALVFSPQAPAAGPSLSQTVSIENTSALALLVNSATITGGNAADFQVFSDTGQAALAPGQKRLVEVVFDPSGAVSTRTSTLRISTGSLSQPTVDVPLTGEVAGIGIAADPAAAVFGAREIAGGGLPIVVPIVLSSSSTGTLTIFGLGVEGADAADFQLLSDTGETTLAAGATRTLQLTFIPSAGVAGERNAVVRVLSDAGNTSELSIPLSGTALVCRGAGDFDCSGCTDLNDFFFLLDNWQVVVDGEMVGISDFLAMLDNWQVGPLCP